MARSDRPVPIRKWELDLGAWMGIGRLRGGLTGGEARGHRRMLLRRPESLPEVGQRFQGSPGEIEGTGRLGESRRARW